jgi:hypothetical protein
MSLIAPQVSPSIIQGWYSRPINGRSNSGRASLPAQQLKQTPPSVWGRLYSLLVFILWASVFIERSNSRHKTYYNITKPSDQLRLDSWYYGESHHSGIEITNFKWELLTDNWSVWRMVSSGLLRRVALVRTDVSEEPGASFMRLTKIGELGTTQAATSNRRTLRRTLRRNSSQRTSVARCSLYCS